ncbi:MAG: RNA polymerase factor sigma-54 [Sporolactobacillus sp.]
MGLELVQRQLLKLKMTPQLLQSVTLLQYNNEELADYIRQKALENPLLSSRESDYRPPYDGEIRSTTEVIEETVADEGDFRESLHQDLHQENGASVLRDAADCLIDDLNDNGYLDAEPEVVLAKFDFDREKAESALRLVQALDPAGVGARSLPECLLLQLKRLHPPHPLAERIISDYVDGFLTEDWAGIAEKLETSETRVQQEISLIRGLTPMPVSGMHEERVQYIVPDVTLTKTEYGLSCEIEDRYLPAVSIDTAGYDNYLKEADKETRHYLREKKEEAEWLLSGISRRKQTVAKIAEMLMHEQERYFESGEIESLRPFTMKQAAVALEVHESTVSRAVAHKYMQTPYGLFPMKKYFVRPIKKDHGEVSAFQIQSRIKKWIETEDKRHPLSDQQLMERLLHEDFHCSRRVIAKYRGLMGISSTLQRRQREGQRA